MSAKTYEIIYFVNGRGQTFAGCFAIGVAWLKDIALQVTPNRCS